MTIAVTSYSLISHDSMFDEDSQYPWNLNVAITYLDIGKAVSADTSAPATAKLAVDGEIILGRLATVETRSIEGVNVGVVSMEGGFKLLIDTVTSGATAPAIGDSVQGSANPGFVKRLAPAQGRSNVVTGVSADGSSVTVLFF